MKEEVCMFNCITFTQAEKVDFGQHLHRVVQELVGIPWCLAFGSALGAYRDGGHVPGDTDIDVMILADNLAYPPMVLAQRFFDDYNLARTVIFDGQYHQIAIQSSDHYIIDLCFFYQDGENYISRCEDGLWKDPVDVIGSFRQCVTKYGSVPLPEKIEDYLVGRYGDWKTPKHGLQCCSIKCANE